MPNIDEKGTTRVYKKEFNLSEKIQYRNALGLGDVKEFIRRIANLGLFEHQWNKIKELAGERLMD